MRLAFLAFAWHNFVGIRPYVVRENLSHDAIVNAIQIPIVPGFLFIQSVYAGIMAELCSKVSVKANAS